MRLTMNAAETGHLVLATVHSSNCTEALQRIINAFPSEIQGNIAAQMADCLIGVVAQRLQFRPNLNICVPECEVLMATMAVKNFIRNRDFFKIISSIETGAEYGMWSYPRYRAWLEKRTHFHVAAHEPVPEEEDTVTSFRPLPGMSSKASHAANVNHPVAPHSAKPQTADSGRIDIEPTETFEKILKHPS
jgi:twitching motility protein PilT